MQFLYLIRYNHPAAAAEYLDMAGIVLPEHIQHVFEILNMPALV